MKNLYKNIVYGFAIGDALGVPFEFTNPSFCLKNFDEKYKGFMSHNQLPGTWSDDTSILLCVLDSKGDVNKYKQNLKEWFNNSDKFNCDEIFDIGNSVKSSIQSDFTCNTINHKGNACLSVALGCFLLELDHDLVIDYINLTHGNCESLTSGLNYMKSLREVIQGYSLIEDNNEYDSHGYCENSYKISIQAFNKGNTFVKCITNAINKGNDTDSNAAFTGALAGIIYDIPDYYLNNLRNKDKIDNIINYI